MPTVSESIKPPATEEVVEIIEVAESEGEESDAAETETKKSTPGYTASLLVTVGLLAYVVRRMR